MSTMTRETGTMRTWSITASAMAIVVGASFWSANLAIVVASCLSGVAVWLVQRSFASFSRSQEKLSADIDVLSKRLLRAEENTLRFQKALDESNTSRSQPVVQSDADSGIENITAEIGLLSGIVRELATVVSGQDTQIETMRRSLDESKSKPLNGKTETAETTAIFAPAPVSIFPSDEKSAQVVRTLPVPSRPASDQIAVRRAFDTDGLQVFLQPVVTLPQRKVVSYEAISRLQVGADLLSLDQFLPVLEQHGRTTQLDRRMIDGIRVIGQHLEKRGSAAGIAYALSPLSLFDSGFLRSLVKTVGHEESRSLRVTLSLSQSSWRSLDAEQETLVAELRKHFRLMLDRPNDLRFDVAKLAKLGVSRVKIPVSLLKSGAASDIAVEDLSVSLGRAGIRVLVCDVEHERDVLDLLDLDVPLAQGDLFAVAKAVRADILTPETIQTPQLAEEAVEGDGPKRSFRDFLRRAI